MPAMQGPPPVPTTTPPRIMVHYPANQADSPVNLAVFQ